ncbi:hypothetical protein BX070DRAFT_237870 [Coemansia spiralis]|nr:hypothetical protein BX070DRAFT_237870 [Coemansia spiralis]
MLVKPPSFTRAGNKFGTPRVPNSGRFGGAPRAPDSGKFGTPRASDAGRGAQPKWPAAQPKWPATQGKPTKQPPKQPPKPRTAAPGEWLKDRNLTLANRAIQRRFEQARQDSAKQDHAPRDEQITAPMIQLVKEDGTLDGTHPLEHALRTIDRTTHTLVLVNPQAEPPVCRVFSRKILYDRGRQAKKQKLGVSKTGKVQRVQIGNSIGDHDLQIKVRKAAELLVRGRRVEVVVEYKGKREGAKDRRGEIGAVVMDAFGEKYSLVSPPAVEGRFWSVMFQGKS